MDGSLEVKQWLTLWLSVSFLNYGSSITSLIKSLARNWEPSGHGSLELSPQCYTACEFCNFWWCLHDHIGVRTFVREDRTWGQTMSGSAGSSALGKQASGTRSWIWCLHSN